MAEGGDLKETKGETKNDDQEKEGWEKEGRGGRREKTG